MKHRGDAVTWDDIGLELRATEARRLAARALTPLNLVSYHRVVLDDGRRAMLRQSPRTLRWAIVPPPLPFLSSEPARRAEQERNASRVFDVPGYDRAVRYEADLRSRTRHAMPPMHRRDWYVVTAAGVIAAIHGSGRRRPPPATMATRRALWHALGEEWEVLQDAYLEASAFPEADYARDRANTIFEGLSRTAGPRPLR